MGCCWIITLSFKKISECADPVKLSPSEVKNWPRLKRQVSPVQGLSQSMGIPMAPISSVNPDDMSPLRYRGGEKLMWTNWFATICLPRKTRYRVFQNIFGVGNQRGWKWWVFSHGIPEKHQIKQKIRYCDKVNNQIYKCTNICNILNYFILN